MARFDRKKNREGLRRVTKETNERKTDGSDFKAFFIDEKNLPFYSLRGVREHMIDIIPYRAGPNDPNVAEGEAAYLLQLWVHKNIGAMDEMVVCPAKNYHKPCPICERAKELAEPIEYGDKENWKKIVKPLKPTLYDICNVIGYEPPEEEDKGIQILWIADYFFGQHLQAQSEKSGSRGGETIIYADPDEGRSIAFKKASEGQTNTVYEGHHFEDRKVGGKEYVIEQDILDNAYTLDEHIILLSYKEIEELFYGGHKGEPEKEETDRSGRSRGALKEEMEEEPGATNPCPEGLEFGKDHDTVDQCKKCTDEEFGECQQAKKRLDEEVEKEEPKKEKITRRRRK